MHAIRGEYERIIHNELRVLRQRAAAMPEPAAAPVSAPVGPAAPPIDYLRFSDRFRGTEEHVQRCQQIYVNEFRECRRILDIGCGRGEFLQVLKDAGIAARGIDSSEELVRMCKGKGLEAEQADLFEHLRALPGASLDGIFCAQVIEHLPPHRVPEFVQLAAEALEPNGLLAIETPNPECLAIFATHFYLDPTHTRPIPAPLLAFYLEESGFGHIDVRRLSPASDTLPSVTGLPDDFRESFFGALDYAILARRLG
ncbi:MAG: methyltransferase domain-containing protein [bacterium]|nr:methyltransferase domain-containing protein [bacterium]